MLQNSFMENIIEHSQVLLYNQRGEVFVAYNSQARKLYIKHGSRITIVVIKDLADNPTIIVGENIQIDPERFAEAKQFAYPDPSRERIYLRYDQSLGFIFGRPDSASVIQFPDREDLEFSVGFERTY